MKTNNNYLSGKAVLAIICAGILCVWLASGCSSVDRVGGRFSPPEETKELTAEIQITLLGNMLRDENGNNVEITTCGTVIVQGEGNQTCLPYNNKVVVKSGEYLKVQYVTNESKTHRIFVSVGDTTYQAINSGTVSLTEKIK